MEIIYGILSSIVIMGILQMFFPYRPPKNLDTAKIERNKGKYDKLELLAIPLLFLSAGLICFLVYMLGITIRDNLFPQSYNYILKPPGSLFVFCGIILGFGLIRIPLEFVFKLILKDEYELYTQYTNKKHGYDGGKLWYVIEKAITLCGIVIFVAGLNWYIRIDSKKNIEINELLSLKTHTYNISEISEINSFDNYVIDNGIQENKKLYTIKMNDGYEWNSKIYNSFSSKEDSEITNDKIEFLKKLNPKINSDFNIRTSN